MSWKIWFLRRYDKKIEDFKRNLSQDSPLNFLWRLLFWARRYQIFLQKFFFHEKFFFCSKTLKLLFKIILFRCFTLHGNALAFQVNTGFGSWSYTTGCSSSSSGMEIYGVSLNPNWVNESLTRERQPIDHTTHSHPKRKLRRGNWKCSVQLHPAPLVGRQPLPRAEDPCITPSPEL